VFTHICFSLILSLATRHGFRSQRAIIALAVDWGALSSLRHALSDEFFEILEKVCFSLLFIFQMKLVDFS